MTAALRTFFQSLTIPQEFQQQQDEVEVKEEDVVVAVTTVQLQQQQQQQQQESSSNNNVIICDNAHSPTTTLLRKQRRKRQVQQLKEQRRRQQTRPIYNRSLSVNSFATTTSTFSSSYSAQATRKYTSLKPCLLLQTREDDEEEGEGTTPMSLRQQQRNKNALAAFFSESHILSPSAVAFNYSNSDHSRRGQEELSQQPTTVDAALERTPITSNVKDRRTKMMIMARRMSPISVRDAPSFLSLDSPTTTTTTAATLPGVATDGDVEDGSTPKTSNRLRRPPPLFTRGDSMSSLMEATKPPFLSPIVRGSNINSRSRMFSDKNITHQKKNSGKTKMLDGGTTTTTTTTSTTRMMSPRSARWSLVRQESDSVLFRPSRRPSIDGEEDCYY